MTVGDTLDGAFQVLRSAWPVGVVAVLAIRLLNELLQWAILAGLFPRLDFLQPGGDLPEPSRFEALAGELVAAILVVSLLAVVLTIAASLVVLVAVDARESGRRPRLGEVLLHGLRRAPGLALATVVLFAVFGLVVGLLVGGAAVLGDAMVVLVAIVFVPLVVGLVAVMMLLPAASVLEGRGAWAALGRSLSVVRRRFGRVLGVTLLVLLLLLVIAVGVGLLALPFVPLGDAAVIAASILLNAVSGIIFVAVTAGAGAMLLLDAAARLEGADLAARARGFDPGNGTW